MNDIEMHAAMVATDVAKELALDAATPSAKSIGSNLGLLVDGTLGWLGVWGEIQKIKQSEYIENFKNQVTDKISSIPEDNLKDPNMSIVGPAIESSKFFYEEPYFIELFSNLVAAACDESKKNTIHPSYVDIIKQLSPMDAKFLSMYKYNTTYPMAEIKSIDDNDIVTPCTHCLFNFKDKDNSFDENEQLLLTSSLENLTRLGLIIKNKSIHEFNFNYDQFKEHNTYHWFSNSITSDSEEIHMTKYRLELSSFGINFTSICFDFNE